MFSSKTSAITYANTFLSHWGQVDQAIGAGPAFFLPEKRGVIPANFNRSGLTALRDMLSLQLDGVQSALNGVQFSSGSIDIQKAKLFRRMRLFIEVLDAYYSDSAFIRMRPDFPNISDGPERFLAPLRDVKDIWLRVNAAAAPSGVTLPLRVDEGVLVSPALVTQAEFAASITALEALYVARSNAERDLITARSRRDETIEAIYHVLLAYRNSVGTRISTDTVLLNTIPRLSPEPGHTPEPVVVTSAFQAPNVAIVNHTESLDSLLESYQAFAAPGADADFEDAVLVATHTERAPAPFSTSIGLDQPGGSVSLWVKVNLTTGNERTSERSVVTRPQ